MTVRNFVYPFHASARWLASAVLAIGFAVSGPACVDDPDCGVCDPDNLFLQSITGLNYAGRKVHLLTSEDAAKCEGGNCPDSVYRPKYFVKDLVECGETEEAQASQRPSEYCKISPLMTFTGIELVFNNLLEAQSVELTRKNPEQPVQFEIYEWKSRIAELTGPITRYNGDYVLGTGQQETSARSVNLTCVEKLTEIMGGDVNEALLADPTLCDDVDPEGRPLRMQFEGVTKSFGGITDTRLYSCTPGEGVNTCCSACNYEQGVNVAKYGVDQNGERLTPENAIECPGGGDPLVECRDFITDVNRDWETVRYTYSFPPDAEPQEWRLPLYDKLREVHPAQRPEEYVRKAVHCTTSQDCLSAGLPGAKCYGTLPSGDMCDGDYHPMNPDCSQRMCQAEWFVACVNDSETVDRPLCVDTRFRDVGAGACFVAEEDFLQCAQDDPSNCVKQKAGARLSNCDSPDASGTYDSRLTATECCQPDLGGEEKCDPLFQPKVRPIARYDRLSSIREEQRLCYCGDPSNQPEGCADDIEHFCTGEWGDLDSAGPRAGREDDPSSNEGSYTTRFVKTQGGVLYDPALKGVSFRPADSGAPRRALLEECASRPGGKVGGRNYLDGWRRNDQRGIDETFEDFDRGMCSGSTYKLEMSTEGQHVKDKRGNTLDGRSTYTLVTPQFHVEPDSGFPATRAGMGACGTFNVKFSNKYDLSPLNLQKIAVFPLIRVELNDLDQTDPDPDDDAVQSQWDLCSEPMDPEDEDSPRVLKSDRDVVDLADCWIVPEGSRAAAGGEGCADTVAEWDKDTQAPCLQFNVAEQERGRLAMSIPSEFGKVFFEQGENSVSGRYRVVVPDLGEFTSLEDLANTHSPGSSEFHEIYSSAFLDVCGMPLVSAPTPEDREAGARYRSPTDHVFDMQIKAPTCKDDTDFDGVELTCDNAKELYNPDQTDSDKDAVGDVRDLCSANINDLQTDDPDRDGIGTVCDLCSRKPDDYNKTADNLPVAPPAYMFVRSNNPMQIDTDRDGVGDACDNCPSVPNCAAWSPSNPWTVEKGAPPDSLNGAICNTDTNNNWIGDACEGEPAEGAAGPVGLNPDDDFDQDGMTNEEDKCPRMPRERVECTTDDDCGDFEECASTGVCNHRDSDVQGGDNIGDECDSCPAVPNQEQNMDGMMQVDDPDGDFVGDKCETAPRCEDYSDPRPYAFWRHKVAGMCCVATYNMEAYTPNPGDGEWVELDPPEVDEESGETINFKCRGKCDRAGFPIMQECDNEADPDQDIAGTDSSKCRRVPDILSSGERPGVMGMPAGCEELIGDPNDNEVITLEEAGSLAALWSEMCFLPQWDLDFDGIGDGKNCDMCPYSYDPDNEPYINDQGKIQPRVGKWCNGKYDVKNFCDEGDGGDDDDDDTGDTGDDDDSSTGG